MYEDELTWLRHLFAQHAVFASGGEDRRLEAALAEIPREDFLGSGPWQLAILGSENSTVYRRTPDANPHWLYQDCLVGIVPEKELNNGVPSFLTYLISLGQVNEGEHVVHIGAGLGYYTAVLAKLAGDRGRVTAIEFEPELAQRARINLARLSRVEVHQGDGATMDLGSADVVLVNAGATKPADNWVGALADGGRLILPLTTKAVSGGDGIVFLIERRGDQYSAAAKSRVGMYHCVGARDPDSEAALTKALESGGVDRVRFLRRTDDAPDDICWVRWPRWALTYE